MFCTHCGVALDEKALFCSQCGASTPVGRPRPSTAAPHRLTRPRDNVKAAGVCAGFARYLGMDVTLVRILWVVLTIWPPLVGLIAYIVCWAVMPKDPPEVSAPLKTADATR